MVDEIVAVLLPIEEFVHSLDTIIRRPALFNHLVDIERNCRFLLFLRVHFLLHLFDENASKLRDSKVSNCDRSANEGTLERLNTLDEHQLDSFGQHLVNESLIGSCELLLTLKILQMALIILLLEHHLAEVEFTPRKNRSQDIVIPFLVELINIVAELYHMLSYFNEDCLRPHHVCLSSVDKTCHGLLLGALQFFVQ